MILDITSAEVVPDRRSVLEALGIPRDRDVPERIDGLYESALLLFEETAAPAGIVGDITEEEFGEVYAGEGMNAPDSVVQDVFPQADHLTLFAVTLGAATSRAIAQGFESHDYALASMLDAVASEAADLAADVVERRIERDLREQEQLSADGAALRYSPGYCGWHVTGQQRLFRYLEPQRIGISLTDSCLMQPLKSVSGVIIAGQKNIHRFSPTYAFCAQCETHSCRERMRALFGRRERAPQGDPT